ncbi:MAG: 5-bromo-4-chloroindolyl phosphate hydrolysis family protein [Oscillospiraceae bacterium]|nr:5-bromo-4-chloroindolyl phosphate hydrolysis family protein [Oscillospiraceae bacterium]
MKRKKPIAPYVAFGVTWVLYALFFSGSVHNILHFIPCLLLSLTAFGIFRAKSGVSTAPSGAIPDEQPIAATEKPSEILDAELASLPPRVREIVKEGRTAQAELGRLYASIPELSVKRKVRDIMEITDKIVQDAKEDPDDVRQIGKFFDYYLPTTIKLLNAYDRMGAQGIAGETIDGTMKSIEEMLDTALDSYRKLLDSLFENQALDIETDIQVMNTLLKREGFSG